MTTPNRPDDPKEPIDDELVPEDDAVIGRVFRWSLLGFAAAALLATMVWLMVGRGAEEIVVEDAELALPRLEEQSAEPPSVRFTDVTRDAGIDFVHENGARGAKLMPETMGSGAAFFDYDGDSDPDLLLVNAAPWPGDANDPDASSTLALYRNDGRGRFEDVTAEAGLDLSFYGVGVAVADYDADGDADLYLTAIGPNRLLRNDAGRFVDVTSAAGAAGPSDAWGTSAGFFDADRDGDLDLFVAHYVEWSAEIDRAVDFRLTGIGRAYGPPKDFVGSHAALLRNEGDGRFVDVSEAAGLHVRSAAGHPVGKALGIAFLDADRDGFLDVVVANDTVQNFLFRNRGDGTFEERGVDLGLAFDPNGAATGAMGIDVARYRGDGAVGIAIGNFANEMTSLYVSQGRRPVYSDEAIIEGIGPTSRAMLTFGLFFFDYDLDGRLDLLQANGHLEEEIAVIQASQQYRQPAQLFWNGGAATRRTFVPVDPETTGDLAEPIVGRAATFADIDADGDLDVLLTQPGAAPRLLRNDQALGRHWLRVALVGDGANRDAIGARVVVEANGAKQHRLVSPTRSYLAQVELPLTFGLGRADRVDRITITWPDGTTETLEDVPADQLLVVRKGSARGSAADPR